ncbi:hypothetical protein ABQJ48_28190 [Paraburkholderia sp. DGU8]|jgi:hypothetical protein
MPPDPPGATIDARTALMVDGVEFALDELDPTLRSTLDEVRGAP